MLPRLKTDKHFYDNARSLALASLGEEPLFVFRFDLDRENAVTPGFGAANGTEVHVCCGDAVRTVGIAQMEDIEYIQYIGCAAIEYT